MSRKDTSIRTVAKALNDEFKRNFKKFDVEFFSFYNWRQNFLTYKSVFGLFLAGSFGPMVLLFGF